MSERICEHCQKLITDDRWIVVPRLPERQTYFPPPKDSDALPTHKDLKVDCYHLRCRPELSKAMGLLEP